MRSLLTLAQLLSITLGLVLGLEAGLRLVWHNPYAVVSTAPATTRLHQPKLALHANVGGLYASGGRLRFAVGADFAIVGAVGRQDWAIGGSTTECGLVPEGQRWPDLLAPAAYNYGVSGNSLQESYQNLVYLLTHTNRPPQRIYILHAINDLRHWLSDGPTSLNAQLRPLPQVSGLDTEAEQRILGIQLRDSTLLSWLAFSQREWQGRNFLSQYQADYAEQQLLPLLPDAEFPAFFQRMETELLPQRLHLLEALRELSQHYGISLVVLTQAHAYRLPPQIPELRLTPPVNGQRLSLAQAADVLDRINQHTLSTAAQLNLSALDTAGCMQQLTHPALFYDSVHLTPLGSRQFARCVQMLKTTLADSNC